MLPVLFSALLVSQIDYIAGVRLADAVFPPKP